MKQNNLFKLTKNTLVAVFSFLAVFFSVVTPVFASTPDGCKVQINFDIQPKPYRFNRPITLSGYIKLDGSVFDPPGTPNAGYCYDSRNNVLKKIAVVINSKELGWTDDSNAIILDVPTYSSGPINFSKTITPSDLGLKAGQTISAQATGYNASSYAGKLYYLVYSSAVNIKLGDGVYATFGCVADDGKYACSGTNNPSCSDVTACKSKACIQIDDSAKCGTIAPVSKNPGNQTGSTNPGNQVGTQNPGNQIGGGAIKVNCDGKTDSPDCVYNPLPTDTLLDTFLLIGKGFFVIIGAWAALFIIVGGFKMVMAQGNEEAYAQAKKTITWAILGVVVASLSFSIVAIVQNVLGSKVDNSVVNQTQNR